MLVLHKKDIANYVDMDPRLKAALQMIADGTADREAEGRVDDSENMWHSTKYYQTKSVEEGRWESHDAWIDIQYIRVGRERIDVLITKDNLKEVERRVENDVCFYEEEGSVCSSQICLEAGMMAVFYPADIHKPGMSIAEQQNVEKIVYKIRV